MEKILQKSCGVHTAKFLKYIWLFFSAIYESVKTRNYWRRNLLNSFLNVYKHTVHIIRTEEIYFFRFRLTTFFFFSFFFLFLIGIHSTQGWTATTRHYKKKKHKKRLQLTGNLFSKKPTVKMCLLILDLKPLRS